MTEGEEHRISNAHLERGVSKSGIPVEENTTPFTTLWYLMSS